VTGVNRQILKTPLQYLTIRSHLLYTQDMKKSHAQPYWWDWPAVSLLFILLQVLSSRLVTTTWTPYLNFIQIFTSMGFVIGLALGYSQFERKTARWISFGYMLFMLPLIWTRVIDEQVELDERLLSVGGRLLYSISEFFSRRPVEDPLFFVAIMSITFWVISASAGFSLTRHQNFLATVLPSAIGILVIQHYDNGVAGRVWFLAFFTFIALFLLGRLNFLQDQRNWRERRVFLSPENSIDLTSSMAIAAGLLIITAWTIPLSITSNATVREAWERITKPWTDFTDRMENAVSALESPSGGRPGEFYGTELELGNGFPLSDAIMFNVEVPELPFNQKPPRFYWRGRTYDYFSFGQWYTTGTTREEFSPAEPGAAIDDAENGTLVRFVFTIGGSKFSLLYAPSQPVWFSRPGSYLASPANSALNITSWNATPALLPGETYQVDAVLKNPNIEQLRATGAQYPQWVTDKYLQMPENFSPRIKALAEELTATAETPYDKTVAITRYLRENIEYAPTVPDAPRNTDPLEWIIFEYKKGYCVYYATSEILMLRSIGIPARMAVGFAQGTGTSQSGIDQAVEEIVTNSYTVRKNNAHAWPEVYFPDIGWVEFEPTGNQAVLDRPLAPREDLDIDGLNPGNLPIPESDSANLPPDQGDGLEDIPTTTDSTVSSLRYLIPLLIAFAALTIYLSRRYALTARIPAFVRTTMERSGIEVPNWIMHWERWSSLSSIERSFESINFGLRQVKQPAPIHATPFERANSLANILPQLEIEIKVLLDEHQTSLYTSRVADEKQARRAAFQVRTQVILALIRYFWTGNYEATVTKT
jgi:transglutaminase-like putative cysteine protease